MTTPAHTPPPEDEITEHWYKKLERYLSGGLHEGDDYDHFAEVRDIIRQIRQAERLRVKEEMLAETLQQLAGLIHQCPECKARYRINMVAMPDTNQPHGNATGGGERESS